MTAKTNLSWPYCAIEPLAIVLLASCSFNPDSPPNQCSQVACLESFRMGVRQGVPSGVPPGNIQIQLCRNGSCFDTVVTPVSSTDELALSQDLAYGARFASAGCGPNDPTKPTLCIFVTCSGSPPFPQVDGDEFKITVSDPLASFEPNTFTGKIAYETYSPSPCKNNEPICRKGSLSFLDPGLIDRD